MNRRAVLITILIVIIFAFGSGYTWAQEHFYKDKVIRLIVGFSAGGGFDTNARIIARHMGKHIPGNPSITVENMTGAGSQIAANHVYKAAKSDGLTIGTFAGGLVMNQVFGKPGIEFDARKFVYLGVPAQNPPVCALTKASGITGIDKWMAAKQPVKLGGLSPGNTTDDVPKILKATIDLPIQVVTGYKGTSAIRLAAESGEIAGGCWDWNSVGSTWRKALDSGEVTVVLQTTPAPLPNLPKVPLAISFAKTEEARRLIQVGIHEQYQVLRLYVLPPGTPKDRTEILRKAFQDTMKDPAFKAEMDKARLDVDPILGSNVEKIVNGFFSLPPSLVTKLVEILK
ncbi:MAG: Bug family tripartite tricarboxylate transporter substrate binding protein [Candidatus Binatia bacterium]